MTGTDKLMNAGFSDRKASVESLRSRKEKIASVALDEFLGRHPGWLDRFGEVGRTRSLEDYAFHVEFLAGSILARDPAPFESYVRWAAGMLESRGVSVAVLIESVEQIRDAAKAETPQEIHSFIDLAVEKAVASAEGWNSQGDAEPPLQSMETELSVYLQAVLAGDRKAALTVAMEALGDGNQVGDLYQELLAPAQVQIGRMWERNQISVADEHLATAITQYVVAQLYTYLETPSHSRGRAVVTGVEGELHQIGANMVADMLESDGWNTRFLGTQLPHRDVIQTMGDFEPRILGISAAMLFNLSSVADLVEMARRHFGSAVKILVGGRAFMHSPEVWREMGADGFAWDLRGAVRLAGEEGS